MLKEQIALVTGASRGVGKGIAQALGAAGATVYVTGRTERANDATVPLPGTIHETAALVTQAGGTGIAIRCDHRDDDQVRAVFDQISNTHGRLDLLVNNAWEGYQAKQRSRKSGFHTSFWKLPPTFWDTMFTVGVRSHYVAGVYGAAIMAERQRGLIIQISSTTGDGYSDNVAYGVSKAAVHRLTMDMAHELKPHRVAVIALCPDIVATEMIMARRKNQALEKWMESPLFVGRAVVALATDPQIMAKTGSVLRTRALAQEYGFTDIGGHEPQWKPEQ
ncbi:MAG TPA: SDR family NAD(P)-dependent oxidoreductase [Anaerolineales bacterium]|nr:SDR family NAD(P)-dependent oxidoreductase [Anaerolineales bacterium]